MTTNAATWSGAESLRASLVHVDSIKPFPGNPRRGDIEAIAKSLKRFGQQRPVLVQIGTNLIVAGNHLYHAARLLSWDHVAVTYTELDDTEARAYLLADNQIPTRGQNDPDALGDFVRDLYARGGIDEAIGFESAALDRFLSGLQDSRDPDLVPALPAPEDVYVKSGEVWLLGRHRLIVADALDTATIERLFADGEKPQAIFTSPPYAVGVDYGTYEDTLPNLRALLDRAAPLWFDLVAEGGFAVINFGDLIKGREAADTATPSEYPMALEYWPRFSAAGWHLWSRRIWCKPNARVFAPWTARSNRAASDFEHVWTWKRPGTAVVSRVDGAYASPNGWFDSTRGDALAVGKDVHGAGMPTMVAARMITIHSRRGGLVHEPFAGTGTTIIAAEQADRTCYAAEIEPRWAQVTIERWQAFTGEKARRA